ncbi:hypothetical protein I6A60_13675 [Frankia sp. AgB1.9]|uniref:hypothetical protein n=1 Tax=unclassified Frankia TaxID=2632575 RepID=UPI0019313C65|nr:MULTISPECIES: hypothetical protein [unclassified Frankia]MBL7487613.1 hypothetical protein [Frankia sp. AgW1.1]MBL7548921.1 hypothetical protein [Frankia sp. AgB1.9]MBL7624889.1 hypothetical protein [Frankia sp. AgB1.8]
MGIFSFDDSSLWRTPETGPALVLVTLLPTGECEVTIHPGADVEDVTAALAVVPAGAVFVEHFNDVEAVLLFRRNPAGPPAPESVPLVPVSPLVPAAAGVSRP